MVTSNSDQIKQAVQNRYRLIAKGELNSCCSPETSCCDTTENDVNNYASSFGYSKEELSRAPEGANMALGCGNPSAIAELKNGDIVLDLGSGGGFDCFLASDKVGVNGKVIGVDMTPEMLFKARENALKGDFKNVEFRLGEIEYLPVADSSVNVILSNCVINLSPDKQQVFNDAFRVLKPGGYLAISDVVLTAEMPGSIIKDLDLYSKCASGAVTISTLETMITKSGFVDISITPKEQTRELIREWVPEIKLDQYIVSAIIRAQKPALPL